MSLNRLSTPRHPYRVVASFYTITHATDQWAPVSLPVSQIRILPRALARQSRTTRGCLRRLLIGQGRTHRPNGTKLIHLRKHASLLENFLKLLRVRTCSDEDDASFGCAWMSLDLLQPSWNEYWLTSGGSVGRTTANGQSKQSPTAMLRRIAIIMIQRVIIQGKLTKSMAGHQ